MIRIYIHNHTDSSISARRDGLKATVEITDRVKSASWALSLRDPFETARVTTSIRINELDKLGLGTPRRDALPAIHASGWLEIRDEDMRVFYGPINRLSTGLSVDAQGARRSQGVTMSASSWLSIVAQPFKLTTVQALINPSGLYDFAQWADVFEQVFARGAVQDVAEGLRSSWSSLVPFSTPEGDRLNDYRVLIDSSDLGNVPRSLTRVVGANISQVPTATTGSLWATFSQTFAPAPQLIELFPTRENGEPILIYRMKPLAPSVVSEYFDRADRVSADTDHKSISAHRASSFQEIDDIISYSLEYRGDRNNYIEVTSSYLGVSPLVGVVSTPYVLGEDVTRYGLHPLEITYPLIRKDEGSIRETLETLTEYATALYAEGHAFATASIETIYSPKIRVGEWARWYDYTEGGSMMTGYVNTVSHQLNVDTQGKTTRRTSMGVERVSQYGRPSAKKLDARSGYAEVLE